MVKVRVRPGDRIPPATGPIYYATRRGVLYASAKPRPRGRGGTAKQLAQQEWFTQAARAVRYMDAEQIHVAKKLTQHYPVMWRDYLMLNLAGRFGVLQLEDGRQIHSLSEQQDVSDSLDAIGQAHGDILFRASGGWRVLSPTIPGYQLQTQGPNADPIWQPGVGTWQLVEHREFNGATATAWLNLAPQFQHQWVISDIKVTGINREFHAQISQDNGISYKTTGYRGMRRFQDDVGNVGSNTFTGSIMLIGGVGRDDNQSGGGVFECLSDLGLDETRKQFRGWNTEYNDAGTFFRAEYAGSYEANLLPINAVAMFINGDTFAARISLWRRPTQ